MSSAHPVTPLILTDALMGAPDLATRASSPSAIAAWSRGRWIKEALPTRHQKKLMPVAVTAARAYRLLLQSADQRRLDHLACL
jgi:hypothetical protein